MSQHSLTALATLAIEKDIIANTVNVNERTSDVFVSRKEWRMDFILQKLYLE